MKKSKTFTFIIGSLMIVSIIFLIVSAINHSKKADDFKDVTTIDTVTARVEDGPSSEITLPYQFKPLDGRSTVSITTTISPKPEEILYIKSVYAPAKIYADDKLIYQFGEDGSFPKFMTDPATEVTMVNPHGTGEEMTLKMVYQSPNSRNVLTVHPHLMGDIQTVLTKLFSTLGFSFTFSLAQLLIGVILIFIAIVLYRSNHTTILGLFALSSGLWALGECNFTGLIIKNPTLLYFLTFIGFFSYPIPLIQLAISTIEFKNAKPITLLRNLMIAACTLAFSLQIFGVLPFSKMMYVFHFLCPVSTGILAILTVYEALKHRENGALRFSVSISLLTVFVYAELLNYYVRFTYIYGLIFQIGVMIFAISSLLIGGFFIRNALVIREEQNKRFFQLRLMEVQIEEQEKRARLLSVSEEDLRKQRHDLRHHLTVISELTSPENTELHSYIANLIEDIPAVQHSYCENKAVNAIVSHYATLAKSSNIELSLELVVPKELNHIADNSLCVIFGNLLENGIEACSRMTDGKNTLNSIANYTKACS